MLASSALVRERLYQLRPRVRIGPTFGYLCQNSSVPGGSAEKNKTMMTNPELRNNDNSKPNISLSYFNSNVVFAHFECRKPFSSL